MDHFVNGNDHALLENDRYTFFVLKKIVGGECRLLLSDHKSLILCYSCPPWPVWIWTPDNAPETTYEQAYQLLLKHRFLEDKIKLNVKYGLADYLIQRAERDGIQIRIRRNMFAYDCPCPIKPEKAADGEIVRCTEEDIEELVDFRLMFQQDTGVEHIDADRARQSAREEINAGTVFFWRNAAGAHTASCKYAPNGDLASLGLVFTRREYRRRHYAQNLVYAVTVLAKDAGYLPMLYTNADYPPSNACYSKIGYIPRGRLCTVAAE